LSTICPTSDDLNLFPSGTISNYHKAYHSIMPWKYLKRLFRSVILNNSKASTLRNFWVALLKYLTRKMRSSYSLIILVTSLIRNYCVPKVIFKYIIFYEKFVDLIFDNFIMSFQKYWNEPWKKGWMKLEIIIQIQGLFVRSNPLSVWNLYYDEYIFYLKIYY
jgi:hypothetical protein